jgi:histidinol-phosphate phosphatase family protein
LDRDDTLLADEGHMTDAAQVRLLPGVRQALLRLQRADFRLVLISNQSVVGRGWATPEQVQGIQQRICRLLPGVSFAGFEYCFHRPDESCDCRKPRPGMLLRAARRLDLDLARSVMVGDRASDVLAGQAAGCKTVLLGRAEAGLCQPDHVAADLAGAAEWILKQ